MREYSTRTELKRKNHFSCQKEKEKKKKGKRKGKRKGKKKEKERKKSSRTIKSQGERVADVLAQSYWSMLPQDSPK